jgi:hypothetical protein
VHDRRVVRVQVVERLCGVPEVVDRELRIEPGATATLEQRLQIRALDPVHRDDVPVVHEEVLADERETRMGTE